MTALAWIALFLFLLVLAVIILACWMGPNPRTGRETEWDDPVPDSLRRIDPEYSAEQARAQPVALTDILRAMGSEK